MFKFTDLALAQPLLRAAADLGFEKPTPIQADVIPWLLDNDGDLIALAQTGTGKTAAFGFPVLSATNIEATQPQTLILCPTRELCLQIYSDFQDYAKYMPRVKSVAVYGGAALLPQKKALQAGTQIVIGTPGRVQDFIRQGVLKLERVEFLVLDEADEMLNMGFKEDLFSIMEHTPKDKQTMLFSATMPSEVSKLASTFMKNPHQVSVAHSERGAQNILHFYYKVQARDKYLALKRIADMNPEIYGIVFCRTRNETQDIADKLQQDGYNADALHGDLSQAQRELVMNRFRTRYVRLLVATDVAARGLDVDDLTHIINYHLPTDPDIYIHRSGRTGRAGKHGIALSIIHSKEFNELKAIEKRLGREIQFSKVPDGSAICEKQLFHFIDTVEKVDVETQQIEPFLRNVYKKLGWMTREELIQRFVSVEFNRFLNYYKDTGDLNYSDEGPRKPKRSGSVKLITFRLGIGYVNDLNKRDLMRYINGLRVTRGIEIGQINIFETHCFVELDSEYESQLLKAFARNNYRGVPVEAQVSEQRRPERQKPDRTWKKKGPRKD